MSHSTLGWQEVTNSVAKTLGQRDVVAVLWGQSAQELKPYFADNCVISSVHPSPLSAYRGFFGSKPFSQVNQKLTQKGLQEILW
jgi:uracil-DNA glycosylase